MSIVRALFGLSPKKSVRKGLSGFQQAGPIFDEQTSATPFEYLKLKMVDHFSWSPKAAEVWLRKKISSGDLERVSLTRKGIVLTSPGGSVEYKFKRLAEGSWEVIRIKPDTPMPEA